MALSKNSLPLLIIGSLLCLFLGAENKFPNLHGLNHIQISSNNQIENLEKKGGTTLTYLIPFSAITSAQEHSIFFPQLPCASALYLNNKQIAIPSPKMTDLLKPYLLRLPDLLKKDNIFTVNIESCQYINLLRRPYFGTTENSYTAYTYYEFFNLIFPITTGILCAFIGLVALLTQAPNGLGSLFKWGGSVGIFWGILCLLSVYGHIYASASTPSILNFFLYPAIIGIILLSYKVSLTFRETKNIVNLLYGISILIACIYYFMYESTRGNLYPYLLLFFCEACIFFLYLGQWRYAPQKKLVVLGVACYFASGALIVIHDIFNNIPPLKLAISESEYLSTWHEPIFFPYLSPLFTALIIASLIINSHINNIEKDSYLGDQKKKSIISYEHLVQELHDRFGSRLITALIGVRNNKFNLSEIEHEIETCINELKQIINQESHTPSSITKCLEELLIKMNVYYKYEKIRLTWNLSSRKKIYIPVNYLIPIVGIFQECLTNCLKHSQAKNVRVQLRLIHQFIIVQLDDDGVGLSLNPSSNNGRGAIGMEKKAAHVGARLYFRKRASSGLVIRLIIKNNSAY
jgi:two-component sensor histidine kinase